VALRTADPADAQWVARELADPNDPLHVVSTALDPAWRLDRIVAVGRPRGACLRVDLRSDAEPSVAQAAALADFVSSEAKRLFPHADSPDWVLQDAVLGLDDPREAANVAAWQALSARLEPGPERTLVSYFAPGSDVNEASFRRAQTDFEKAKKATAIETVSTLESGHGKLTVLLASPCGTLGETSDDAGELATMTSAVARAFEDDEKVHLSPWITPDAVGLLVESDSLSSSETASDQAERTAREIARALLAPLEGSAIHGARQSALAGFGKPAPDWWLALETLAPRQLSALSPQGSWTSVGSLVNDQIIAARRLFVSGPLRLAVLAGRTDTQAHVVQSELSRLLGPLRPVERQCPTTAAVKAGTGLFRMEAVTEPRAQALVAVDLPPASHWSRASEAEWTVFLLNRKGGWLERRLLAPGLVIDARAQLLGGRRARAIVIELHTADENADAAVAETRRLLLDLARGAVTAADLAAADTFFREQSEHLSTDPRQRVVALWQGGGTASRPSLESLQKLHAEAFREDHHLVVIAQ
jgi:hypothetical protein